MRIFDLLPIAGAIVTTALGFMGLVMPQKAARFTNLAPEGLIGWSEIRATYGGFFLSLGLSCLYFQMEILYFVCGMAWIGAALGRTLSVVIDKSTEIKNFGGIAFEGIIGLSLLFSHIKTFV